jgi:hypothetical protein
MTGEKSEHYKMKRLQSLLRFSEAVHPFLAPSWLRKRFSRTLAVTPK